MSKTSKDVATSTTDPQLAKESNALLNLFKMVAGEGYQPNRNVNVAGFTPQQIAAQEASNTAADAFGLTSAADNPMPMTRTSGTGIEGYATADEYDKSVSLLPKDFEEGRDKFYNKLAKSKTKYQQYTGQETGGGKK